MATGIISDIVKFNRQVNAASAEALQRVAGEIFTSSNGAIRLVARRVEGDYEQERFFKLDRSMITSRDDTSTSAANFTKLDQDEEVRVKVKEKIRVANTIDSFVSSGYDEGVMAITLGQQIGDLKAESMVDKAIASASAAIKGQSALVHTPGASISHKGLNGALKLFGDRAGSIAAFVLRGNSYFDLVDSQLTAADTVFRSDTLMIAGPTNATLGKPVVVIDSPSLYNATPTPDESTVLGLVADAVEVIDTAPEIVDVQKNSDNENIELRYAIDYEYAIGCKGVKWDVANGGRNPSLTALSTSTNWDKVAAEDKGLPGVALVHQVA